MLTSSIRRFRFNVLQSAEGNHWDDVIFQYKEMVMHIPTGKCELDSIIQNLLELVTSESCTFANTNSSKRMMPIHVIDLGEAGSIGEYLRLKFTFID